MLNLILEGGGTGRVQLHNSFGSSSFQLEQRVHLRQIVQNAYSKTSRMKLGHYLAAGMIVLSN